MSGTAQIIAKQASTTINNGSDFLIPVVADSAGNLQVNPAVIVGGERNTSNSTNNFDATKHECNTYILANSVAAQNIGGSGTTPIYLMGITVTASTTGTITIVGFTDPTGAAASLVIPAITLTTAQTIQVLQAGNARRCESGCTITCSVGADGPKISVDWRPIN